MLLKQGYADLDHVRRRQGEPLVQADILVQIRVEDFKEFQSGVTDVLNIVSERGGNIS